MNISLKEYIEDYIIQCNLQIISDKEETSRFILQVINVFYKDIPNIGMGLNRSSKYSKDMTDEDFREDLETIKQRLRFYLVKQLESTGKMKVEKKSPSVIVNANSSVSGSGNSTNTNTNTQNQTVNNTFDIKVELDKVRAEVEADEVLGDEDKEEINEKLNEIEEVMNGSPTNNEKWKRLKGVVNWVTTKGFKIGKMIMPIITKALFPEE